MQNIEEFIPSEAIVTYKLSGSENIAYVEKGKFVKKNNDYKLQGLTPFDFNQLKIFMNTVQSSKGIYLDNLIPSNVLFHENSLYSSSVMWIAPKAIRRILFDKGEMTGDYLIPDTLFFFTRINIICLFH